MTEPLPELLLIDKPKGITSFDVIRRLRRRYSDGHDGAKAPKMGHAGTLDPLATGLMIIGVGPGTKRLTNLVKLDKEYLAEVLLGERRTTGDMEGEVMEEKNVDESVEILRSKISVVLEDLVGELHLPVSAYSAIKVDGVPMYKRARQAEKAGELVTEVPTRVMKVYEAELFKVEVKGGRAVATVRFRVGSGTYIRSLAEMNYPATLQNLRRTKVGEFGIELAEQIDGVKL
jgi:tRNA pseudouridine55 synthase